MPTGYLRRHEPANGYREASLTGKEMAAAPALPLLGSVFNKSELAVLLSVPATWVATHASVIPGSFRLGRNLRFRRQAIEEWLGGDSPLLKPEQVADVLRMNTSWIYAHADQIPGVLRLGYYIRFRPSALLAFVTEAGTCQ